MARQLLNTWWWAEVERDSSGWYVVRSYDGWGGIAVEKDNVGGGFC